MCAYELRITYCGIQSFIHRIVSGFLCTLRSITALTEIDILTFYVLFSDASVNRINIVTSAERNIVTAKSINILKKLIRRLITLVYLDLHALINYASHTFRYTV